MAAGSPGSPPDQAQPWEQLRTSLFSLFSNAREQPSSWLHPFNALRENAEKRRQLWGRGAAGNRGAPGRRHADAVLGKLRGNSNWAQVSSPGGGQEEGRRGESYERSQLQSASQPRISSRLPAGSGHANIEALYVSHAKHYAPNVYTFGYSFKPWTEYWAVLDTGEVYLGIPHGDPRTFDFDEERRLNRHRFVPLEIRGTPEGGASGSLATGQGRAAIGEGRGVLEGASAPERGIVYGGHFIPLSEGAKSVVVDKGVVFHRVESSNGCILQGTFSHDAPRDMVEASQSFGLHDATAISFSRDCTFQVDGCTNICFRPNPARGPLAPSSASMPIATQPELGSVSKGNYSIIDNIIEFHYDGGPVEDAYFFRLPGDEENSVSINGVLYKRTE